MDLENDDLHQNSDVEKVEDDSKEMTDTPASPPMFEEAQDPDPVWTSPSVSKHDSLFPVENNTNPEESECIDESDGSHERSEHSSDYDRESESDSELDYPLHQNSSFERGGAADLSMVANRVTNHSHNVVIPHQHSIQDNLTLKVVTNGDEPDFEEEEEEEDSGSLEQSTAASPDNASKSEEPEGSASPENEDSSGNDNKSQSAASPDDAEYVNFVAEPKIAASPEESRNGEVVTVEQESAASPDPENSDFVSVEPESAVSPDAADGDFADNEPKSAASPESENGEVISIEQESAASPDAADGLVADNEPKSAASPESENGKTSVNQESAESPDPENSDFVSVEPESAASPDAEDGEFVGEPKSATSPESENDEAVGVDMEQESAASRSLDEDEEELRKLKAQLTAVEEEEAEEDLEEGEIEDDDDSPPEKETVPEVSTKEKEKSSSSKHHHHSTSKEKTKDSKSKTKEKDSKSERRRKHSVESKEDRDKDRDKSNKKRSRKSEDLSAGDEDYLFIRGASLSPPTDPTAALSLSPSGRKVFDTDPFGNPIYEDELDELPLSPASKRRRRSRSPGGGGLERRRRDEARGSSRRPTSGRKEIVKPLHKSDQICAYYMQGKCQKSHEECSFSHNAVPPRKMELCKFWMLDCCAKKEKCLYLHNDFPCKYYHTGLVCKLGLKNQCKFSHKPMNEVTKAVLLKHIETAPKEILGDFPRLNRQGALNLIAKMENKINGELKKQERERDEERRRTRWEQPTKDDEHKLQELMEEAGLGNFYQETVEGASQKDRHDSTSNSRDRDHRKPQHGSQTMHIAPLMGILPNQLPPPMLPPQPHMVNNPALANVLATLQIPSTSIQRPTVKDGKETNHKSPNRREAEESFRHDVSRISPDSPPHQVTFKTEPKDENDMNIPENLPPMQRDLFRRIQERQIKNENKIKDEPSDDEKPDDRGWYSSDEETDKSLTDVLKQIPTKSEVNKKPVVDFASVLSAIRKTTAAASNDSEPEAKRSKLSAASPPLSTFTGRGDVDFRIGGGVNLNLVNTKPSTSQGPFRDTDFRMLPALRQEFKDVDLRKTDVSSGKKSPSPVFKPMPTGPANMIDAAINSHPPMTWKVRVVAGVKPPDYNYVKHTLTPAQLSLDPRFGPRTASGISLLPDPASPPQSTQNIMGGLSPANIPGGDALLDPRMSRRAGHGGQTADPRLGGDPRAASAQTSGPPPLLPPGWPNSVDMTHAALAAQFMAAQQLGLLPFPNPGGMPIMPPNFVDMNTLRPRHPRGDGRGSGPPSSSWERYSQQQSGGLTPPL